MNHNHRQLFLSRGDPGFFDVIKRIGRTVTGAVGGFVTGGPLGAISGALGAAGGGGTRTPVGGGFGVGEGRRGQPPAPIIKVPGFQGILERAIPGGATGLMVDPAAMGTMNGMGCPRGFRPNKSSYFLRSGEFVPRGSRCVRVRRRNNANGRALRRSISRVKGFEREVRNSRKALRSLARI